MSHPNKDFSSFEPVQMDGKPLTPPSVPSWKAPLPTVEAYLGEECKAPAPARKDDNGKLRFDLIPARPMEEVARVFTIGAAKYADRNWEKGLSWGRVFAAMLRHAWAYWRRERNDATDGQHHLASVCWCAMVLMEYERTHPELDDRAT